MRNVGLKSGYAVLSLLALVFSVGRPLLASPTPPTANLDLNSAGSGLNYAGVYTSPYTAEINPGSTSIGGATVNVICDDFASNSYVDEDWNTYVTSLSSLATGIYGTPDPNLFWKGASSDSLNQLNAYTVAALLSIDILQSDPGGESGTTAQQTAQEEYSYALWELFDPTVTAGTANMTSGGPPTDVVDTWLASDPTFLSAATNYLATAITQVTSTYLNGGSTGETVSTYLSGYNVTIYTYNSSLNPDGPAGCGSTCPPPPQEFITVTAVPEASSLAMFAAYLLFGGEVCCFSVAAACCGIDSGV